MYINRPAVACICLGIREASGNTSVRGAITDGEEVAEQGSENCSDATSFFSLATVLSQKDYQKASTFDALL